MLLQRNINGNPVVAAAAAILSGHDSSLDVKLLKICLPELLVIAQQLLPPLLQMVLRRVNLI